MIVDGIEVPDGLKVTFRHLRKSEGLPRKLATARNIADLGGTVAPRGGTTVAFLQHLGSDSKWEGRARCSEADNYVKVTGRRLALGRALASMDLKNRRMAHAAWGEAPVLARRGEPGSDRAPKQPGTF